ncbi:MAG: 2-C-methyl-D-erythritol 2,4-cyclodiphosphate synthase [Clostridiales bacterium]|nr:2-C-methyl-D-erythritol 2,4-cyclodiphosphate synthase [Clostridiales bacterium]
MRSCTESQKPNVGAVIVCAGRGERTGLAYNKVLYKLGTKTMIETVLDTFYEAEISPIVLVCSATDLDAITAIANEYKGVSVVLGGATRTESVFNGLKACRCDIVAIHDGARPYATKELILRTVQSAIEYGSGIAAVKSVDTVKRVRPDGTLTSLNRAELMNMQTPQTFRYNEIFKAYESVSGVFTDDAEVYEKAGFTPRAVEGSYDNIKITTAADLLKAVPHACHVGIGFDVHKLVEGRKLILGGVQIDYDKGLLGHSDADVLTHAIMDALLSAADLPDIGVLFPDTDDKFLGVSSMKLLNEVVQKVKANGFAIENVSAVIAAQKPKLMRIIPDIRRSLSTTLGIELSRVNVSATTTEELGIIGEGRAIAANASCILSEVK